MLCNHCGRPLPENTKFCTECGAPVTIDNAAPAAAPTPTPPRKKKAPLIAVIAVLVALAILAGVLVTGHIRTNRIHDQAVALYREGAYAEALELFETLDTNSAARYAQLCRRQLAEVTVPTPPETIETTAPTEATEPAQKLELAAREAELVYELEDSDVDLFYTLLEEAEALAMTATNGEEVDAQFEKVDEAYEYLLTQHGIAMVLYYCDLKDEAASDLYLKVTDIATEANDAYMQSARRIWLSDCPHKDILFEDWTEEELQMLEKYTDEVMRLEQRNSEIEVAYQDMQDSATMYDDMVPLYIEMVQNNNRIAEIYGYDNYYTYAYEQVYTRDYDPAAIEQMRTYVSKYLPDATQGALDQTMNTFSGLSALDQLQLNNILWNHYESGKLYLTEYLTTLPESVQEAFLDMFNGNILLMQDTETAMEGAFTTDLTEERSLCFFGPGYSNVLTVLHEGGHYYGSKHATLSDIPMDLAETQSQGNEWLFVAYLENTRGGKLSEAIRSYKMYSDMTTILICVIVDEFEQAVYSHPNIASLTGDDLDAIMEEVCERYGGIDLLGEIATDVQNYWRMVVVEQPVYYISYGVSAIAAMNVYTIASEDYEAGIEAYCSVVEGIDMDEGFLTNITNAGLDGPFDEEVYKALYDLFG